MNQIFTYGRSNRRNRISPNPSNRFCLSFWTQNICLSFWAGIVTVGVLGSGVRAEDQAEFPYTLVVSTETADVLSGPGKTHYATDRLPRGSKVQVFRHDPGGYYAIRPPKGSFSLVLASAVKPSANPQIVEVESSSAKAWVGSRLQGNFKPMWQLKLKPGELLNVVRKVNIPGAHSTEPEIWYQVEPPRGEFRWIHKDQLGPHAPASISTAELTNRQLENASLQVGLLQQMGTARQQAAITSTNRDGWKVLESDPRRNASVSANEAFYAQDSIDIFPNAMSDSSNDSLDDQIDSVDLALSQMVLAPKQNWRLETLQPAVDRMRREATTGQQLAKANRLAQKIIDFQKIKAESTISESQTASRPVSLSTPSFNTPNPTTSLSAIRYDGRGVLRKLYTDGGAGASIYALEDERGKVVQTISPSSGVNLERFVGKPVGLFGRAGFNRKLNRPHLTAQRVVDLNKIR